MDSKIPEIAKAGDGAEDPGKQCATATDCEWTASVFARSTARWNAWMGQLHHRYRFLCEYVRRPDVAILGSYHGANLGDIGLGMTLSHLVQASGLDAGLHTIHSADKWPKCHYAIVGGGTISYLDAFRNLTQVYGDCPERVAIVGVDFRDPAAIEENSQFLKQVTHISCRSSSQAEKMRSLLQRSDITWHFDACFAAPWFEKCSELAERASRKIPNLVGVNIPPLFIQYQSGKFVVGSAFQAELKRKSPHIFSNMGEYANRYIEFARNLCSTLIKQGYELVHVPFAVEDEFFARTFLQQLGVRCDSFSGNPARVVRRLGEMEFFVPFRYHATVFGLCARLPVYPFCYALKCEELLGDLGCTGDSLVNAGHLMRPDLVDYFLSRWGSGLLLDDGTLGGVRSKTAGAISEIVGKLTADGNQEGET